MTSVVFPFTAIVGQADLKLALLLNAVSPNVGGVLIQGERGNAKTTAVRALADLLPPIPVVPGCPYRCDPAMPFSFCPHCQGEPWTGEVDYVRPPFVELPLGTTEERLLGHPDLEALLSDGKPRFVPGLLAQAHRGILYVDEVNLLDDHLVDNLLDAAASGWNRVEREGFSIVHPARFMLVGTMNPEEGELRPQLNDRFGLAVPVTTPQQVDERIAIMERRLAFAEDPAAFSAVWRDAQEQLAQRLYRARRLLPQVRLSRERMAEAAQLALAAGTEGMRADLAICETARALAAYDGRVEVTADDVRQAARLALFHRARGPWEPEPDPSDGGGDGEGDGNINNHRSATVSTGSSADGVGGHETSTAGSSAAPLEGQETASGNGNGTAESAGTWTPPTSHDGTDGQLYAGVDREVPPSGENVRGDTEQPQHVSWNGMDTPWFTDNAKDIPEFVFPLTPWLSVDSAPLAEQGEQPGRQEVRRFSGPASKGMKTTVNHPAKGRPVGARRMERGTLSVGVRIDWPKTVYATAVRQSGSWPLRIRPEDVWRKTLRLRRRRLTFFLLDASGSMAGYERMAQVKGAVLALAEAAYRRRDLMALAAFRDGRMDVLQLPTRSIEAFKTALAALATGGDTPLALGLRKSRQWLWRWNKKQPHWQPQLILFTDGRVNPTAEHPLADRLAPGLTGALAEVLTAARQLAVDGCSGAVVDAEGGWFRFGGARRIAEAMQVPCYSLEEIMADECWVERSRVG